MAGNGTIPTFSGVGDELTLRGSISSGIEGGIVVSEDCITV